LRSREIQVVETGEAVLQQRWHLHARRWLGPGEETSQQ
jgi:hypothetical protein